MGFHEFFKHVLFFLFFASRLSHFFLTLVVHHLFNHWSCIIIQITEFAAFRTSPSSINFQVTLTNCAPPFHLVDFFYADSHNICIWIYRPSTFFFLYRFPKSAINNTWLIPETNF